MMIKPAYMAIFFASIFVHILYHRYMLFSTFDDIIDKTGQRAMAIATAQHRHKCRLDTLHPEIPTLKCSRLTYYLRKICVLPTCFHSKYAPFTVSVCKCVKETFVHPRSEVKIEKSQHPISI